MFLEKVVFQILENNMTLKDNFVISSSSMKGLWEEVKKISLTNSPVLFIGENGVGKSTLAYQLFKNSSRCGKSFITVNCTFFDESHFAECVLQANDGVLFLNEIDQLPSEFQQKILHLMNCKTFQKDSHSEIVPLNIRIFASSSKNLEHLALYKKFNEDLLFLLSTCTVSGPPLRERIEDVEVLSNFFLGKFQREVKKKFDGFTESAKKILRSYRWHGNVRELENVICRACIIGTDSLIQSSDLSIFDVNVVDSKCFADNIADDTVDLSDKKLKSAIDNFKYAYVKKILQECSWNQTKAAKILDIQRTYISKLIKELRIRDNK